ncbi:hypothetical protein H4R33_000656 [Dimargaris cristalligena]|uniref:Protein RER1 n=1 Tax=Dimargaris cristalligena TaxID=215637 RepID=A0A4P9ZMG3_9FUNG|nr:hypothetical protein H4R33_000656 [Dimargaris cristalligena]RKP33761.1 Rer1 family protein [Dimargaris cristalligena]|eukprot:RKP33761.1 Rer1 family protein [Dimargaris cristalligena]
MSMPKPPTGSSSLHNNEASVATNISNQRLFFERRIQYFLDSTISYTTYRWIFTVVALVGFLARIFSTHGWYIVTYALGIYMLNLFLAFLTPKWDTSSMPGLEDDAEDEGESSNGPGLLPTSNNEEFRPFIRRLPEFKFWLSATRAVLISIGCTFFKFLDIPVFWPILVIYFIILFVLTMRRQIEHMIRHKYLPFDLGKKNYRRV